MIPGQVYRVVVAPPSKCESCHQEVENKGARRFPFGCDLGIYIGIEPSGFLTFRLEGGKWASMNGGCYDVVRADLTITELDPTEEQL